MKFKLTKEERNWILYDVGNSAFVLLIATLVPIYFNSLALNDGISATDYLAYWGYAASLCTIIVAILGPICGTLADYKDHKKVWFVISVILGILGCLSLGLTKSWLVFLVLFIIGKIGFSLSLIFYDSMLSDVSDHERVDHVSSLGYAWGYIGSCIPFILCLVLVLGANYIGMSQEDAMKISFVIIAFWWLFSTLPLLKTYKQKYYTEKQEKAISNSFKRLFHTLKNVKKDKKVFLFLIAFFFYIDGVYTIIDMATAYGTALGFDSTQLLLALLLTQIVAFPFAILFGRLSAKYEGTKLISLCILSYFGISLFAMFLTQQWQFWVLAVLVGMFQGGIQALSRSYYTKIIPAKQSGEYFGLLDICGKGASFLGTTLMGVVSQLTGKINLGVGAISLFFVIGYFFFSMSVKSKQ